MSQKPSNPSSGNPPKKTGGLGKFINSIGGAIDEVVNEVKADLKAMTPPDQADAKKAAEKAAQEQKIASLINQSAYGLAEEVSHDADVPPLPPEPVNGREEPKIAKPLGLPPGNLWQAMNNPEYTTRLRTDACYHALTSADVEGYRRLLAAETVAPFTMGIAAIILQAPLEEELEEGGTIVADDMLLTALLKALDETRLYGAIGAGPRQLWPNFDALDEALTNLLNAHPKLIALGPLGIDEPFAPYMLTQQQEQLAVQLDIAADFNLPVLITHRQSLAALRKVLEEAPQLPKLIWVDVITSQEELDLIQQFSMDVILRPEITAPDFAHTAFYRKIATGRLLLGSGSALVAPHGFSGHFNQPKFLNNTLQASAKVLGQTEKNVTSITNMNLASLFGKEE